MSNSLRPMDYILPGFSVHGILQARILECVTISFSRGSSRPRDQTRVFCIGGRRFNFWDTREAQKKSYDQFRQHIKKRNITLQTNVHLVKAMIFPVVMYDCESWTIKKAESQRIDAFELWCWRRLLRVPWIARRSNQSILKEISPEYSLEVLMLKLKLQYFGHLMRRTDSLEKTLILGKMRAGGEGDDRGWDGWMASVTRWTWVWVSSGSWLWTGKPGVLQSMGSQSRTQLNNWTELNTIKIF